MRLAIIFVAALLLGTGGYLFTTAYSEGGASLTHESFTASEEAGFDAEPRDMMDYTLGAGSRYTLTELREWERSPGPTRVGVQIGHLDNDQVPEELSGLRRNGGGAAWGPYTERDTVAVVAREIASLLEAEGIEVDLLPATVPPGYEADAFLAIHADGNNNESARGYKFAGPRRDYSGRSEVLVDSLYENYGEQINMPEDPNISRRMTAYYAFNWPRYEHAIHPYTPAAIVELGFLTNAADRALMLNEPSRLARAVTDGVLDFLAADVIALPEPQTLVAPTLPVSGTLACAPLRAERRNSTREYPCEPSLITDNNQVFMLPAVSTSSYPFGSKIRIVEDTYRPIQVLDNYFWFAYEASGIFFGEDVELIYL